MQMQMPDAGAPVSGCRRRLGQPRLLIVGCGNIGLGIVARLRNRFRIFAVTSSPERLADLRASGSVALAHDLDRGRPWRLGSLAQRVIYLAPPGSGGSLDLRAARFLSVLRRPIDRLVYVSTTGVYGDRQGARVDESAAPRPITDRARRRLDAERRMRAPPWRAAVLRVPGIYGRNRLPLDRLRQAMPALRAQEDVVTNHIHSDDLERICIAALYRSAPARVYNCVDDSDLYLGQYLDLVADLSGLARPPRLSRAALRSAVSDVQLSFMSESRRLSNSRLKSELRFRLKYPTVAAGLTSAI
jgi:nucleoside-diphosphate-sugar epimerase